MAGDGSGVPEEGVPDGGAEERTATELRLRAERHMRAKEDVELLALLPELEADRAWFPPLWGPAAALAASRLGRTDAIAILTRAVDAGFAQPELHDGDLEAAFATDPAWDELRARMTANIPPPPVELLDWPDPAPALPLSLERLNPDREALLRDRLPALDPAAGAWQAAKALLAWASTRWEHANDHVDEPDALLVLDRAEGGEAFACVEYSIVLTQALNAAGIPARRLALLQENHHTGLARAHQVTEAWIDELRAWVVLDGQNGAYWSDRLDGPPLGVLELSERMRASGRGAGDTPELRTVVEVEGRKKPVGAYWLTHFATVSNTGLGWAEPPYSPIFQDRWTNGTPRLTRSGSTAGVYPDLGAVWIGIDGPGRAPELRFGTLHPYAAGFTVTSAGRRTELGTDERWPLELEPGEREVTIGLVTAYGEIPAGQVRYRVR